MIAGTHLDDWARYVLSQAGIDGWPELCAVGIHNRSLLPIVAVSWRDQVRGQWAEPPLRVPPGEIVPFASLPGQTIQLLARRHDRSSSRSGWTAVEPGTKRVITLEESDFDVPTDQEVQ